MKVDKALISSKKTAFEHYSENGELERFSRDEIEAMEQTYKEHKSTLEAVKELLDEEEIGYGERTVPVCKNDFNEYDLVLSLGGDGTVLNTACHLDDETPLASVCSTEKSIGSLTTFGRDEIKEILPKVEDEDLSEWTRLELEYGEEKVKALNEAFIGAKKTMGVAYYKILNEDYEETRMSSGLVVSTGAGSTGWYRNISGSHGEFPRDSKELRYVEREPIQKSEKRKTKGVVRSDERLKIKSKMNVDGIISLDGDDKERMYEFPREEVAEIQISDEPLKVIS